MKHLIPIFFLLLLHCCNKLYSQKVCGGEILKVDYFPIEHRLLVDIYICREQNSKDSLIFDWGDGHIDTLIRYAFVNADENHVLNYYSGIHFYDTTLSDYVVLRVLNEEVEEGFLNVDYNQNTTFTLSDSIFIYDVANSPQTTIQVNEGPLGPWGTIGIQNYTSSLQEILLTMTDGLIFKAGDSLVYSIDSFPVAGYMPPASEDEFYLESPGILLWDTPIQAGKYAVGAKVREMTLATNPIYEEHRILFSTITKAFTIVVDSSAIVSTIGAPQEAAMVSIYPNPTSDFINVEYGGLNAVVELKISNAQGQEVHRQSLESIASLQNIQLNVSHWSPGVYFLSISSDKGKKVKKILIE